MRYIDLGVLNEGWPHHALGHCEGEVRGLREDRKTVKVR
jgi:hypothetical protein